MSITFMTAEREPDPSTHPYAVDRRRVRAARERAARDYDRFARVGDEVGERLFEHLAPVRIDPARILDVGAASGTFTRRLEQRYRHARVIALDPAPAMLRAAQRKSRRMFSRRHFVCADAAQLPVASGSIDLIFSSLYLQWHEDPGPVFREFQRVLRPGGLVELATLGPDTLRELRESWQAADDRTHVHAFLDMHDIGDALVQAGLTDVVMDTERIIVRYPDLRSLMRELKGLGAHNATAGRPRSLSGKRGFERMRARYESLRAGGTVPASLEIVYAHAWKPAPQRVEIAAATLSPRPP